ncbi:hypothetical protein OAL00_00660 [Verrucomicrobiales bacterium]|nr:hypothetical protein [Verrucomicrobiales bacterium]
MIIPFTDRTEWEDTVNLPIPANNIFQRIIRRPNPSIGRPKERECAEMLCSLLLNSTEARETIIFWLAEIAGTSSDFLDSDNTTIRIDTEKPIGTKRDDLRIEISDDTGNLICLWTIEIKSGASFHYSSRQILSNGDSEDEIDAVPEDDDTELESDQVNQIINYDNWLAEQSRLNEDADIRGFVLAVDNVSLNMPEGLTSPWDCITWTQLGLCIGRLITSSAELKETDQFLCRHVLGFIRENLWRKKQMENNNRIEIDDISLMKAMGALGADFDAKICGLLKSYKPLFEKFCDADMPPQFKKKYFETPARVIFFSKISDQVPDSYLVFGIFAGTEGVVLELQLQSWPKKPARQPIENVIAESIGELRELNSNWERKTVEEWAILTINTPLHRLLNEKDQLAYAYSYMEQAVSNLNGLQIKERIKEAMPKVY